MNTTGNDETETYLADIAKAMEGETWSGPQYHKLMRGLTVKLSTGAFTGSGVVYRVEGQRVFIRTAAHNIQIQTGRNDDKITFEMVKTFRANVRVVLTPPGKEPISVSINGVSYSTATATGWDACSLMVSNLAFAGAVTKILADYKGLLQKGKAPPWKKKNQSPWESLSLANLKKLIKSQDPMKGYTLLQAGYGKTTKASISSGGPLQFRKTKAKAADPDASYLASTSEEFQQVLLLDASDTNTTLPGDSGGPLFAVHPKLEQVFLLGVTLGANFYAGDESDDGPVVNNAVTFWEKDQDVR
ncbi:hypothetical protein [Hyalangium versicolor]|uniref:hypothetical protein n=1 Tax=Hyalangium versicolor TaxID=2861190 RepID=UPI001CCA85C2|nr:hypothetical protein [Hyalangium versicolor]